MQFVNNNVATGICENRHRELVATPVSIRAVATLAVAEPRGPRTACAAQLKSIERSGAAAIATGSCL